MRTILTIFSDDEEKMLSIQGFLWLTADYLGFFPTFFSVLSEFTVINDQSSVQNTNGILIFLTL